MTKVATKGTERKLMARDTAIATKNGFLPETSQRATFVREWTAFCHAYSVIGITAHDVIARLYPPREHGELLDPKWEAFRGAIEFFVPAPPSKAPDPAKLGVVITKRFKGAATRTHDAPAPLQRFALDGKSGGRARWKIEPVQNDSINAAAELSSPLIGEDVMAQLQVVARVRGLTVKDLIAQWAKTAHDHVIDVDDRIDSVVYGGVF